MLKEGETGRVVNVLGGKAITHRLHELGIIPGSRVKMIRNSPGPVIVSVKGSKIALGRGVAMKVILE